MKKILILGAILLATKWPMTLAAPESSPIKAIKDSKALLSKYEVNTPRRLAYFLAQTAHESDGFKTTVEYASGKRYEGRKALGNTQKGDGPRYKGRGLIQLTGRSNYRSIGRLINKDLESNPEQVEDFPVALEVSLAYWKARGLNQVADRGDFKKATKLINGGYKGLAKRQKWLKIFEA